jgi:hypothetical protein
MPDPGAGNSCLLERSLLRLTAAGPVHNSSCSAQLLKEARNALCRSKILLGVNLCKAIELAAIRQLPMRVNLWRQQREKGEWTKGSVCVTFPLRYENLGAFGWSALWLCFPMRRV